MAGAARKPTSSKNPENDHAALALLDAAFCVSREAREGLVRKALGHDVALRRWATQWAGAANEVDVSGKIAADVFSFLESLGPRGSADRRRGEGTSLPLSEAWRIRLASIAERLAASESLTQAFDDKLATQKIDALKEFAYGAGHEINNPLANISARAQTLLRDETHGERRRTLATINRQAMRAHEMIADLMLFARPPKLERTEVDVVQIVGRVVRELTPVAANQATRLTFIAPPSALIAQVDGGQLSVAIKAMIRNAIEAVAAGGNVGVEARILVADDPGEIVDNQKSPKAFRRRVPIQRPRNPDAHTDAMQQLLEVVIRDDGPGLSPREQAHLFDPFFSGREAGRGLGFGLCVAWRIVTDHGGQIAIESELGRGTRVTATLPGHKP
jgi:signal transduction histidine kinase